MADDVVIGSASVQIVGDYSGLEKSFNESTNLAQQAGQKISAAFESSAAGANSLTTAVGTVATSVEDLAAKSGLAGGELAIFKAALQGSLDAGVPLNAAMQDIAASSGTLGTAVASAAQSLQQETQAAAGAVGGNESLSDSFKRVRNDAEALEAAWQKAIEEDKKLADAAKRDAAAFQQAWSDALKENNARAQAEFEKFAHGVGQFISNPLQSAGSAVTDFMIKLGPMGLAATAAAAALAAIGKGLFDLVVEFGAAAETTGNMADRLNLTWRETRNLEEMAQIAGVSISGLQQASFRLAESLDETSANGKKVADALHSIGVSGETSGELLSGFLARLAQIPDDTQRIALAHEVLGKSSQQILPLIKNYGELQRAVQELGPAIGDQLAGQLQKSDDALDKLNISWNRFKESIAAQVAPAVGALVDKLRDIIVETSKLVQSSIESARALADMVPDTLIRNLYDVGKALADWISWSVPWIAAVRTAKAALEEFNLVVGTITGNAARDFKINMELMQYTLRDNLVQSLHKATTGTKEFVDAFRVAGGGVAASVDSIITAQSKLAQNVRDAKGAYDQLATAFKTGTPLMNGHKVTVEEVARALANLRAAEAAASLTKEQHTKEVEKFSKALRPAADNVAQFVKELSLMHSAHQKLIDDAAIFSNTFGRAYSIAEVAAIRAAAAAFDLQHALEALGDENVSFLGNANKIAPLMDQVADSITASAQAALNTDPYAKLEAALDALGIKGQQYYKNLAGQADEAYQVVLDSGVATYEELAQAALIAVQKEIQYALELGEITREDADKTLAQVQHDLDQLDSSHEKSTKTRGRQERTLGEDIQAINKRTFDSLEKDLARSVVNLKGFSDIWKTLWHKLAEDLLSIMFKVLLDPLEKQIGKVLGGIFGGASSAAGSASSAAGGVASAGGSAASAAGSTASAAGSGVAGIVGAVAGVATAISSIVGNFQMAGMNKSLDLIENYTRYLKIGLVEQGDSLLNDMHIVRNVLTDFSKWNQDVVQTYYQGFAEKLDTLIGMGGIHSSGMMASVSNFSTSPAAKAEMATPTVNINIDTVESDVTDAKVTATMNRAFRMSKLAGALPPGRFPQ